MPRQSLFSQLFLFTLIVLISQSQSYAQSFVNGSLTGTPGEATIAPGWTAVSFTPDLNNTGILQSTSGYAFVGTPVSSNDGGTWQNLAASRGFSLDGITVPPQSEAFSQTVTGFSVGSSYTLSFEYANQHISSDMFVFDDPGAILMQIDGGLTASTTLSTPADFSWTKASESFVATQATHTFTFRGQSSGPGPTVNSVGAYMAIDDISFVPEPAMISMVGPASFLFLTRRRRTFLCE